SPHPGEDLTPWHPAGRVRLRRRPSATHRLREARRRTGRGVSPSGDLRLSPLRTRRPRCGQPILTSAVASTRATRERVGRGDQRYVTVTVTRSVGRSRRNASVAINTLRAGVSGGPG